MILIGSVIPLFINQVSLSLPALASLALGLFITLVGIAANKLGSLGPSIGWAMLLSLSIVISTVWGIKFGEWKNSKVAFKYQLNALTVIVFGVIMIALSGLI